MTKFNATLYTNGRKIEIPMNSITEEDAKFFEENNIAVSIEYLRGEIIEYLRGEIIEYLRGEIIVYGCPAEDIYEESEVIIFAKGRPGVEVMSELAEECRQAIKLGLWKDYYG